MSKKTTKKAKRQHGTSDSKKLLGFPEMKYEAFIYKLEKELHDRYQLCNDAAATPSSILLSVLNAVTEAKAYADAELAKRVTAWAKAGFPDPEKPNAKLSGGPTLKDTGETT